jgi:hypothetical protein
MWRVFLRAFVEILDSQLEKFDKKGYMFYNENKKANYLHLITEEILHTLSWWWQLNFVQTNSFVLKN